MSKGILSVVALFLILINQSAAKESYVFGIVPQQSSSKLAKTWGPIVNYIKETTGITLRFATAKSIPDFEKNLAKGMYDFSYMNPHHYVVFNKHAGYRAFAKAKDKKIHGIIVVHKDSGIQSINELNNKVIAFPSPLAFAATLLNKSELKKNRVEVNSKYVKSHDSVYRNVAAKNFVAGGGVIRTYKAAEKDVRDNLRILYKTNGYTPHAFAALPSVDREVVKKVTHAMVDMERSEQGKELLKTLKIKGIIPASDKDWNDVRKIRY